MNTKTDVEIKETAKSTRAGPIAWNHVRSELEQMTDGTCVLSSYVTDFAHASPPADRAKLIGCLASTVRQLQELHSRLSTLTEYLAPPGSPR